MACGPDARAGSHLGRHLKDYLDTENLIHVNSARPEDPKGRKYTLVKAGLAAKVPRSRYES